MPDPIVPEPLAVPPLGPQGDAVLPAEGGDAVKQTTHEVDTDDMFGSTT